MSTEQYHKAGEPEATSMSRKDDKLVSQTTQSGFQVKELYHPEDIEWLDYGRDLGDPGKFPFTRGKYPRM